MGVHDESILLNIKNSVGLSPDYDVYDTEIIMAINSEFMTLHQLGVGPSNGFLITGKEETWNDYFANSEVDKEAVKTCLQLNARMLFDPPNSSIVLETMKQIKLEYETRLNYQAETNGLTNDRVLDYNDLLNKPTLDGVELVGDVHMNLADKTYVDKKIGEIEDGYY